MNIKGIYVIRILINIIFYLVPMLRVGMYLKRSALYKSYFSNYYSASMGTKEKNCLRAWEQCEIAINELE